MLVAPALAKMVQSIRAVHELILGILIFYRMLSAYDIAGQLYCPVSGSPCCEA